MIKVYITGRLKNKHIKSLIEEYLKRSRLKIKLVETKDNKGQTAREVIKLDSKHQLEFINKQKSALTIALDEHGEKFTSREFARFIKDIMQDFKTIAFIIGGPFGLAKEVKNSCDKTISLSKLTFTHELAALLLIEQLYRAETILKNLPYHK